LLADDILAALRTYINGDSTKVMTAPIERADGKKASTPGVLRGRATRAAVLVELGFIGVPAMAASMATSEWQSRAACGVDAGLREWLKLKEGEKG
jgi:N-acetylmuramoyl-L-alanine amidase